jgi:NAD(P)-dependent dehydrogenase (short-subunit alcohol dehydrogenase family)
MSVWFVTGASRGLGAAITHEALSRGHQVAATARDAGVVRRAFADSPDVLALAVDVTDERQIKAAVEATVERFGRIDVLVNNAGRGQVGAVEEVSDAAARALFDLNVFGVLNVLRAGLPTLRAQRSGHVINIGSVGGFATAPGVGLYGATKFALEGLSEALRGELAPLGINVTVVEPGGFRTDFLDSSSLQIEPTVIADYAASAGATRETIVTYNHVQRGDPARAAAAIVDVTEIDEPPLRLQLGADSIERIEAKLDVVRRELDQWRSVALSTDHADAKVRRSTNHR